MSRVTLAEAKSWSNIYHSEKDAELQMLLNGAEKELAKFFNRADLTDADLNDQAESPQVLNDDVKVLVLRLFDHGWQNKGILFVGTITSEDPNFIRAAHMYRKSLGV